MFNPKARIQKEMKDFVDKPSDSFNASPVGDNIYIWHFTIKGPPATEFEGGVYHGRIELPVDYPMKPPSLFFLTPNGRYEINTKICLTITDYHPEQWNPSWTIKSMLTAIISCFPEIENNTGIGSLDYPVDQRKKLAKFSRSYVCPQCGPIIKLIKDQIEEEKVDNKEKVENEEPIEEYKIEDETNQIDAQEKVEQIVKEKESSEEEQEVIEEKIPEKVEKKEIKPKSRPVIRESNHESNDTAFEALTNALLQHIQYHEAKSSIKIQSNSAAVPAATTLERNHSVPQSASENIIPPPMLTHQISQPVTEEERENFLNQGGSENAVRSEIDEKKRNEKRRILREIKMLNGILRFLIVVILGIVFYIIQG